VISFGYFAYALALLIVPFSNTIVHFSVVASVSGLAHGVIFPATALIVSRSSHNDLGLANSIYFGVGDVVSMFAPLAFVSLVDMFDYGPFYLTISAITFVGLAYALKKRREVFQSRKNLS
jgi:MFS family permease